MSEDQIKKATLVAEKDWEKEKQDKLAKVVKEIVQETLENIERLEEKIKKLQEEKKQLKMTIDDLKDGKISLLKERLEKDNKAAEVVKIKLVEIINTPITINYPQVVSPWKQPWTIYYGDNPSGFITSKSSGSSFGGMLTASGSVSEISHAVNGTYCLSTGSTVNLR